MRRQKQCPFPTVDSRRITANSRKSSTKKKAVTTLMTKSVAYLSSVALYKFFCSLSVYTIL